MAKITKRAVDALQSVSGRDVFIWDSELRGFGVRVKPSGVRDLSHPVSETWRGGRGGSCSANMGL